MRIHPLIAACLIGAVLGCAVASPQEPAGSLNPEPSHTVLKAPSTGGCGIIGAVVERTEARPDNTLIVYTYNKRQHCHAVSAWHGKDVYERFSYCSPGSVFPGCRTDM